MAGHQSTNMHYVYILQSELFPIRLYRGSTQDLKKRIEKHNAGDIYHTSKFKPWKIVWYCAFEQKEQALMFEQYLKTGSGIAFIRKRLLSLTQIPDSRTLRP